MSKLKCGKESKGVKLYLGGIEEEGQTRKNTRPVFLQARQGARIPGKGDRAEGKRHLSKLTVKTRNLLSRRPLGR